MTQSERICNDIGTKFFCKDFVYENLKFFNNKNNKVELCDALFEYASFYVPLQIKERSIRKGEKSEEIWLNEIVYIEAFEQIKTTIEAIKNNNIKVNDLYHQEVLLHKDFQIFPIIVFDNPAIKTYKRVLIDGTIKVNVFRLDEYQEMMDAIIHPYDIIYYLQERINWLKEHNLPNLIIGDGKESTIIAKIKAEKDFALFFKQYVYDGNGKKQDETLRHLALIGTFRDRQIKKNPEYKQILKILQLIEPKVADQFMRRFDYAWGCACADRFDFTKSMLIKYDGKSTSIVFFSVGKKELTNKKYYEVLCDAKQLQHKADAILIISFIGDDNNCCKNDWIYYEKEYLEDNSILRFYEEIGMFNGTMTFDIFELLCKECFGD